MWHGVTQFYVTFFPVMVAGFINSVWVKLPAPQLRPWRRPIDGGIILKNGRRLFGDHKTWLGFAGYVHFNALAMLAWGYLADGVPILAHNNLFYVQLGNSPLINLGVGAILGLIYALCELPNSFLKRQLGIEPGKTAAQKYKIFFTLLDQADSIFGVVLVSALVTPMSWSFYLAYVFLGTLTHLLMNIGLYFLHLRSEMF
jgi:CDP-diglyceride synthetase